MRKKPLNVYNQLQFEYLHECPICGASEELWDKNEPGDVISHGLHVIFRQCGECFMAFQNPRPTEESVVQAYKDNSYREIMMGEGGAHPLEVRLQSMRAQRMAAVLKEEKITPVRFLDVGSSLGLLVYQIYKAFDCEAWGHEISDEFRGLASGLEGVNFVAELEDLEGKFDVITSIHVLEHLIDPVGQLKKLRELLTDDGVLILECPDGRNTSGMSVWHYVIFIFETMRTILEKAGFEEPFVGGMRDRYFNQAKKTVIPSMIVIAPKNGPYIPLTPQKP